MEKQREKERKRGDLKQLSVHQWLRSAIPDSQQPTSPVGFLFLKLPPPPCAVLLVYNDDNYGQSFICLLIKGGSDLEEMVVTSPV